MPYNIGVTVCGDVAIALWFGSYKLGERLHSRPAAAYVFHTAFVEAGAVKRIAVQQLDVEDAALFPPAAARSFFIDIKVDVASADAAPAALVAGSITPGGASEAGGDGELEAKPLLLVLPATVPTVTETLQHMSVDCHLAFVDLSAPSLDTWWSAVLSDV